MRNSFTWLSQVPQPPIVSIQVFIDSSFTSACSHSSSYVRYIYSGSYQKTPAANTRYVDTDFKQLAAGEVNKNIIKSYHPTICFDEDQTKK